MSNFITPTRMAPRGLTFPSTNPGIDTRDKRIKMGWEQDDRDKVQAEEDALRDALPGMIDDVGGDAPPSVPDGPTQEAAGMAATPQPAPITPGMGVPPAPPPAAGGPLSSITSSPLPAQAPTAPTPGEPPIPDLVPTGPGSEMDRRVKADMFGIGSDNSPAGVESKLMALRSAPSPMPGGGSTLAMGGGVAPPMPAATQVGPVPRQPGFAPPAPLPGDGAGPAGGDLTGQVPGASPLSSVRSKRPDRSRVDMAMAKALQKASPGKAAAHLQRASTQKATDWEDDNKRARDILDLAESGQIDKAILLAKQNGDDIDPQMLQNGKARSTLRTALEVAKLIGADHDEKWTTKFAQAYAQSGDVDAAVKAAGKPSPRPDKVGTHRATSITKDGKQYAATVDTARGTITPTNFEAGTRGAAGAGPAGMGDANLAEWLVKQKIATTPEQAWTMVRQARSDPARAQTARGKAIIDMMNKSLDNGLEQRLQDFNLKNKGAKKTLKDLATEEVNAIFESTRDRPTTQAPQTVAPPSAGEERIEGYDESNREIYSVDGQRTWYYADDDTPYTGDFEDE